MKKMSTQAMFCKVLVILLIMAFPTVSPDAQGTCERIMEQDTSINNLIDPDGYGTTPLGELGNVLKMGSGPQHLILIPGLGFGGEVFTDYLAMKTDDFTAYAITLPGFGGTNAPPSPAETASFGEQTWTNAAIGAIEKLIETEKIDKPIIVGHWLTGTQIALRMALKHPDIVKGVIIVGGSACFVGDTTQYPAHPPLKMRVASIDQYMAPKWFKTVTRATWDDNNFLPGDYAANPVLGLRLWRQAAEPLLHVWVRYLCEFYAQDISLDLDSLNVPTLLLKPELGGNYVEQGNDYMQAYCHTSWDASAARNERIKVVTIPRSRIFIWKDQPEAFEKEVESFLDSLSI